MCKSIEELINGSEKYFNDANFKSWKEKYEKSCKKYSYFN